MDIRKQGEASSSPSVSLRIVSVTKEGAPSGCMAVHADDGSLLFLSHSCIKKHSVSEGSFFYSKQLSSIAAEDERYRISLYVDRLLRRFSYPVSVLRKKLLNRGFSKDVVEDFLVSLNKAGLVDDEAYARMWVQSRMEKSPLSPVYLKAKLVQKGIDASVADRVVNSLEEDVVMDSAFDYAKKLARQGLDIEKIASRLKNRAYPYNMIKKILHKIKA
ncbi:regulatory protein RecX [Spirochaetia bacterium 38H-sp]|uniref:Regulatory protein RecX n=1 Tax=Rarispira pelagica TaxID=3141764 RepID=A0ABU9U9G2_9SPIR